MVLKFGTIFVVDISIAVPYLPQFDLHGIYTLHVNNHLLFRLLSSLFLRRKKLILFLIYMYWIASIEIPPYSFCLFLFFYFSCLSIIGLGRNCQRAKQSQKKNPSDFAKKLKYANKSNTLRESALKVDAGKKNPWPHQGIEPVSAVCQSDALSTELHTHSHSLSSVSQLHHQLWQGKLWRRYCQGAQHTSSQPVAAAGLRLYHNLQTLKKN